MGHRIQLPFKVGQQAESRSFEEGYRGAWFRCKIQKITRRKGKLGHLLEYVDFPEEKLEWSLLYQEPEGNVNGENRVLMRRPAYPPIFTEKQLLQISEISEVTVVGGDSWRVGDLVDWWTTDCYWSGRITELLGDKEAKIQLDPPPFGEGLSCEALLKDLRPSLNWSPELGWTVPTQEGDSGSSCARLVKPINHVIDKVEDSHKTSTENESAGSFISSPACSNSANLDEAKSRAAAKMTDTCSLEKRLSKKQKKEQEEKLVDDSGTSKTSEVVVADSGQNKTEPAAEEGLGSNCIQKKIRANGRLELHSKRSDLLEAAILDLEEYVNKVKWLKHILRYGISSSDARDSHWEFVE